MIRRLLRAQVDRFERRWNYPLDYGRALVDVSPLAAIRFSRATKLTERPGSADVESWCAAKVATALHDDCGPCTQLARDMAAKHGVAVNHLHAMAVGDEGRMSARVLTGRRFARAVLSEDPDSADRERAAIVERSGRNGLIDLSLAIAGMRLYPTLKRSLGFGASCRRLTVDGERVERAPRDR